MAEPPKQGRANNFGLLRLVFAALVIVSHSPEMADGNRSHEILTRLFGTLSFGELAVDGFFLVSGYLITKSFADRPHPAAFLIRRSLRIFPGYLVSFWICVGIFGPLVGADASLLSWPVLKFNLLQNIRLGTPAIPGALQGLHYPAINNAMWTLIYEFRCYLAVGLLGTLGVLTGLSQRRARWPVLALLVAGLAVNALDLLWGMPTGDETLTGVPFMTCRLFSVFGVGALFYLFRDFVKFTRIGALAAALMLPFLLSNHRTAEAGVALLGGYLVFWFALACRPIKFRLADARTDISYGMYLYAWPIQSLILWHDRAINPFVLCLLATIGAGLAGFASWHVIERPANALARGAPRQAEHPIAAS